MENKTSTNHENGNDANRLLCAVYIVLDCEAPPKDVYFGKFKWYRKMRKGTWYKHQFTKDAEELTFPQGDTWWARYGKINRYSDVIATEVF